MSNLKTVLNVYWSLRRYLYTQFPTMPTYYNSLLRPKTTSEKFLMVHFQEDRIGKLSYSFPRIFCVSKTDPELIKLKELVSSVVEKFSSPSSGKRYITLYNQSTDKQIGLIEVDGVTIRPTFNFEEGYVYQAVDLNLKYQVEQRHL